MSKADTKNSRTMSHKTPSLKSQDSKNRKLNRKKAKAQGTKVLQKLSGGVPNEYLRALVNPEQYESCYPDTFGGKTTVAKFIYNKVIRINPADGHFFGVVNPTLPDHVIEEVSTTAATRAYVGSMHERNWVVDFGAIYPAEHLPILSSAAGVNKDSSLDRILTPIKEQYQLPKNLTGAGQLFIVWDNVKEPVKAYAALDGGAFAEVTNGVAFAVPQATETVKIGFKGDGQKVTLTTFKLSFILAEATTSVAFHEHHVQYYKDLQGEGDIEPLFQEYRTVAMSTLISCETDVTHNGGPITGKCVSGGESAVRLGWVTHPDIAELPDSFEGPLANGLYTFWVPTDEKDMVFRPVGTKNHDGDLPSFVFSGIAASPTECILRIRTCLLVEAKCSKAYIPTRYSRIAPHEILQACLALQGQRRIMENPLHLQDIKDFLRSVMQKGEIAANFVSTYGPAAAAIAKAAAAFLL